MTEQNRSDDATNVTSVDGSHIKWDIVKEFSTLTDALREIQLLRQREEDILAGIQLVVKGSNAGRDKEIERLRAEIKRLHSVVVLCPRCQEADNE